ncbi:MAG: ATP-dependent DNA helicase RecG [Bacteroidales bacterium]|nr:ATP-dependent DNA helicase RecG [Bacteroidales bacterium]
MSEFLKTKIEYLKGVGSKKADILRKEINISTYYDLLYYFPYRYVDKTHYVKISEIQSSEIYIQVVGKIVDTELIGNGRSTRLVAKLADDTGVIDLVFFKGLKWVKESLIIGNYYVIFGKPTLFNNEYNFAHPEFESLVSHQQQEAEKFSPQYNTSEKMKNSFLNSKAISKLTKTLIQNIDYLPETLPKYIIQQLNLISYEEALKQIHFPKTPELLERAKTRLKFEELFFLQLENQVMKNHRVEKSKGFVFSVVGENFNNFYKNHLPFALTNAQQRAIKEIRNDMRTSHQMNRLLQGDVGSGKTIVGLFSMLIAIDNGFQATMIAPTEILAQQHFNSISKYMSQMPIKVELLTGSTKLKERKKIFPKLIEGEINILIGTHAILEDNVVFNNLGLCIIDEQHRFGVEQRAKMWKKNSTPPHILVMTATPIPRTLAMTVYGDLDSSVLDELPPGRKPIKTLHIYDSSRLKLFSFMHKEIAQGRQIYIVYPLIKESEKLDLKDLMDGYESIAREFPLPKYQISIVHGQMKPADKDFEMDRFKNGKTNIMVSTTVIEVGVDVPNASVMVIENAERFGLSQLHQLRGRVGRGADQSYCILVSSYKLSSEAQTRIQTMCNTNDGFEIAEVDLRLRGPGEITGTKQSGILDLKIADIVKDEKLLKLARYLAMEIIDKDPSLSLVDNQILRQHFNNKKSLKDYSKIS